MFCFVRHGETDYTERGTKIYQGHGTNLAPLSETGIGQIKKAAKDIRLQEANLILCSSYTRAVQSAAILSKELGLEIRIETDLHEWVANDLYIYEDDHTAEKAYEEYVKNKGVHPDSGCRWEDAATIRRRVLPVLQKYADVPKVIVIGHGMMIEAVTGAPHPKCGEIVPFSLGMKENIVQKLTSKDDKYACAFTDRIVAESHDTDEWYEYFEDVASLLDHPKSLVRNRALYILAANAQWDEENRFDLILPDYLKHITDEKPITARQCVKALAQVGLARPQYIPQILSALRSADLSKYKDSMRPLIERDMEETEKILINSR